MEPRNQPHNGPTGGPGVLGPWRPMPPAQPRLRMRSRYPWRYWLGRRGLPS